MDAFQNRRWVIIVTMLVIGIVFVIRLLFLQVVDDKWQKRAEDITTSEKMLKPSRGLIYDRNGTLLVSASQVYDIKVIPRDIGEVDTMLICKLFGLSRSAFDEKLATAIQYATYAPSTFIEGMNKDAYGKIAYEIKLTPGFYGERNTQRGYPNHIAAHVLGYIRGISAEQYEKDQNTETPYYNRDDYVGKSGLELVYEQELRGERGQRFYLRDRLGNEKVSLRKEYAIAGKNLYTTIDSELQRYGELLMKNKLGCIVALEPSTGEILSMVSAPSYDPELFAGRDFSKNYQKLLDDDTLRFKPLINKALYNDSYRPGSIFKLVQALIAMQEGLIQWNTPFICNKELIGCHNHPYPSNVMLAIQHSCNPYFYHVYKRMIQRGDFPESIFKDSRSGTDKWSKAVKSFGLGVKLGTDIPGVKSGNIPDANYYDNEFPSPPAEPYGKHRWAFSTIYSNSIGEGEIGVSPLQMANLAAIIANRGFYFTPHFVRKIGGDGTKREDFKQKKYTVVDSVHFTPVVDAMEQVVLNGTARRARIDSISICGKTGTVENKSFNDHSVFIAFAPKENPKIAVAVYVEYGTWGGTWAAPIASLMIEKYLHKKLSEKGLKKEERILNTSILSKDAVFN